MYNQTGPGYAPPVAGMQPTAPPVFDPVPGYEGTAMGGGGGFLPPPAPLYPTPGPDAQPVQPDWNIPSITEDMARMAFRMYAKSHCCYSSGPADDGVITNMEAFNTYRYRLETFTESRTTEWAHEPYDGQPVNAYTQQPPGPWDIQVETPTLFEDHTEDVKVPYTNSLKDCHTCIGSGKARCKECDGSGTKQCWVCNGSGTRGTEDEQCSHCNGRGRENCSECHGHGVKECDTCGGKRQLLMYISLKVVWKNNVEDYVVEQSSGLQAENLSHVSGKKLFKDTQYMVYPVMGFPDPNMAQASERLVREHQAKYSQEARIHQQQQTVELIPVTKVTYKWKGDSHNYFVFGNEFQVHVDNYPATCCCTIM